MKTCSLREKCRQEKVEEILSPYFFIRACMGLENFRTYAEPEPAFLISGTAIKIIQSSIIV